MSAKILDGKKLAAEVQEKIAQEVKRLGIVPGLATILVGENPASQIYVKNKGRACEEAGMQARSIALPSSTTEKELLQVIQGLNEDRAIHGILVQLPLPKGLDEKKILTTILPEKDVDGFHPFSPFVPCTPLGILKLIESTALPIEGKEAVVVGRSNIVGKPTAQLLLNRNATVTICHSRTKNLAEKVRQAEILVAAIGKPEIIKGDWIKPGAVVIDVGINRMPDGKLVGDVEFEAARRHAAWITPVPGGVGPMTIAMLLQNTLQAAKQTVHEL